MSTLFLLLVVIIVLLSLIRIQQISDDILKASGLRNVFVARETSGADVSLRMAEFFNMKQKQALELQKKSDALRKNSEALEKKLRPSRQRPRHFGKNPRLSLKSRRLYLT